jgi:diguanylate cyclase (GGDEF)-like protein
LATVAPDEGGLKGALGRLRARASAWSPAAATPGGVRQLHFLVALIAPALMLATIFFMGHQQNAAELASDRARAVSVAEYLKTRLTDAGADNANWDSAYRNAVLAFDVGWLDESMGPDAYGTIDFHDVYVVDASGRTLYASVQGKRNVKASAAKLLGDTLKPMLVRASRERGVRGPSGFGRYGAGFAIYNVTEIRPIDSPIYDRLAPKRFLVVAKLLNEKTLGQLEQASGFKGLRVVPLADRPETSSVFSDALGRAVGAFAWRAQAPGLESALAVLPIALFVFVLLAYAGFVGASYANRHAEELVASQREALRLAHRDALTDLPNRRGFVDALDAATARGETVAVVYMDLDGFKEVNDAFGHAVGDTLLVQVSRRIQRAVADAGQLARFGGDEFAVLVIGEDAADIGRGVAEKVISALLGPTETAGKQVFVGASIGIAVGAPGLSGPELIRRADVAMYAAKDAGRRRWRAYDPSMDEGRLVRRQIADELRASLAAGQVQVSYQPIVDAHSTEIVGAEALARWTSPTLGVIDPGLFISVAEESGLISQLTRNVLREACTAARHWPITLSVNLSAAEVWDLAFVDDLLGILRDTGMPPARLELEITESYLLREPEAAADTLALLRELGVKIALDDFGMGFASLGYLKRLPLDRLKLTHEFLADIVTEAHAGELAASVVGLARALGLPVTAEGVETEAQANLLRAAGCSHLQGWLYGRPISKAVLGRRLSNPATVAAAE